ncbi:cytochrome P450 2G1-like [Alligator sinensis]|uniref:Cytochrome P450 2G1-like n=1 Tax=Alligator sinensis TaxID=38654 RepID=A0A1U7RYH5_ALLSI|nr:cytochrome P450 2G1-like [Alligator sinensis]
MVLEAAVTLFLAVCVSALAFQWEWERWHRRRKLPPVVNLLQHVVLFWRSWRSGMLKPLMEVKEKFGPVFTLYMRFQRFVVLSSYDAVKEALVDHAVEFGSRGAMYSLERLFKGHGVILVNGERWKQLRRFSSSTLKNFGMGKRSIEEQIQVEAQHLVEAIREKKGSPFNPALLTTHAVSNITCSIVFGNRFDYEDENFLNLMGSMNNFFLEMSNQWNMLYEICPRILQFLPGPHKRVPRIYKTLHEFILERVRINQQSLDPSCPRDYIDSFLIRMEQEKQNPLSEFHTTSLVENVIQLFIAGTETTSSTLRYGFLLLAKYPEVQDKVHEEIDGVIGQTHGPGMQHRSRMPYTNAVIHEIQRFANILPLGLLHKVACDTHFQGYFLPKDTPVCISLSTVLHDPKYFKDPESFDPGHFLDENGCFKQNDAFLPFSAGKRVCLGKSLALMELFLILTTILQRFTLTSPKPPQEINLTPKVNILVNVPPSYELYVLPREDGLQDRA